jgi:hypothetical protein
MALPLEQGIVQQLPQAAQRVTDGGLRQIHFLAGARQAAFRIDRIEDDEQVQVDLGYMEFIWLNKNYSFDEFYRAR